MSWMDSCSRPAKTAATPPPFYLTNANVLYCQTCGRVISRRKSNTNKSTSSPVKYCSERCRRSKPSSAENSLDRRIEEAFVTLLNGQELPSTLPTTIVDTHPEAVIREEDARKPKDLLYEEGKQDAVVDSTEKKVPGTRDIGKNKLRPKRHAKGDPRPLVPCDDVEEHIFGSRKDPEKTHGRKKNKAARTIESKDLDDSNAPGQASADRPATATTDETSQSTDEEMVDNDQDSHTSGSEIVYSGDEDSDLENRPERLITKGSRIRPAQQVSLVNGSVGGEKGWAEHIQETPEMLARRLEGQKRIEERELVRNVARRGCIFGFIVPGLDIKSSKETKNVKQKKKAKDRESEDEKDSNATEQKSQARRKCEAVMQGTVVEPSFAKGGWGIRWREE